MSKLGHVVGFVFGGQAQGHARGHLLGNQLGGAGNDPRNLVTIFPDADLRP